ncbi:MAG: TPM domain-containing protein [Ramlibacter sp.]
MLARLQRLFRHRWIDDADLRRVLPASVLGSLEQQVAASEQRHSGEIRIHMEAGLPWSYVWRGATARERAVALFGKLRVWDTEQNNGVLIYLLMADNAIELVADRGLMRVVPQAAWDALVARMEGAFHAGRFEQGLQQAVDEVSALLAQHFPLAPGTRNPNELPDAPSTGPQ